MPLDELSCTAILIFTTTDKPRHSSAISNGISAQTRLQQNQLARLRSNRFQINNWTSTCQKAKPIEVEPFHEMSTPTVIFYGRLVYFDVLERKQYFGLISLAPRRHEHDRLGDKYPKYVKWA